MIHKKVRPFKFIHNSINNLKYYAEEEDYHFYSLILSFLLLKDETLTKKGLNLFQLNCSLLFFCQMSLEGMNQLGKYAEMDITELFHHLKMAIMNMGDKNVIKTMTLEDWDTYALKILKNEKVRERKTKNRIRNLRRKLIRNKIR